jgi:hypothetical protein
MLVGTGMLRGDGEDIARIDYKIAISTTARGKSARGTIFGRIDPMLIMLDGRELTIVRDDNGYEMSVIISSANAEGSAQIVVNGDPGPL